MKKRIHVKNTQDIQKINTIVSRYNFDIWIHSKSGMVDAKSILGIFALSMNEELFIVIEDTVNYKALFKELEDYMQIDE